MCSSILLLIPTAHPATAPATAADNTPARISDAIRKGNYRVTDNIPRTTRSWNELRDEAAASSLAVVDAGDANVIFSITPKNNKQEQDSTTRTVLINLIEHGGTVRILGPAGSEEGVRQS